MRFANSPILWVLTLFAVIGVIAALRAAIGYRTVRADALEDHAYRQRENMRGGEVDTATYSDAFLRVHAPRATAYLAAGMGLVILLTFPILRIADLIMKGVWELSGRDRTWEPGFLVYQFGILFFLVFFWALVALVVAKTYHSGTVDRVETLLYEPEVLERNRRQDMLSLLRILLGMIASLLAIAFVAAYFGWVFGLATFIFLAPLAAAWGRTGRLR